MEFLTVDAADHAVAFELRKVEVGDTSREHLPARQNRAVHVLGEGPELPAFVVMEKKRCVQRLEQSLDQFECLPGDYDEIAFLIDDGGHLAQRRKLLDARLLVGTL